MMGLDLLGRIISSFGDEEGEESLVQPYERMRHMMDVSDRHRYELDHICGKPFRTLLECRECGVTCEIVGNKKLGWRIVRVESL